MFHKVPRKCGDFVKDKKFGDIMGSICFSDSSVTKVKIIDFYITLLNDYIIPLYKNSPNELSIIDGSMDSNKVHMSLLQYQNKKSQE